MSYYDSFYSLNNEFDDDDLDGEDFINRNTVITELDLARLIIIENGIRNNTHQDMTYYDMKATMFLYDDVKNEIVCVFSKMTNCRTDYAEMCCLLAIYSEKQDLWKSYTKNEPLTLNKILKIKKNLDQKQKLHYAHPFIIEKILENERTQNIGIDTRNNFGNNGQHMQSNNNNAHPFGRNINGGQQVNFFTNNGNQQRGVMGSNTRQITTPQQQQQWQQTPQVQQWQQTQQTQQTQQIQQTQKKEQLPLIMRIYKFLGNI